MSLDAVAEPVTKPVEDFLGRARRLLGGIDPYLPGPTRESAANMVGAKPADIAKLSSNENPLGASPKALKAIADMGPLVHEYPSPTADALRRTIGTYLGVGADQIVVGAGSSSLMHAIVDAFSSPGGEIISLDPGFTVYPEIAKSHGRKGVQIPLRQSDFLLDLKELERAITPRTQIVFLTRPNNPTSTMIPLDVFAEAAKMAAKVGALAVSDEAYIEFADIPKQSAVELIKADPAAYRNVMFTRTCSKAFGLGNMRIGYGVGSKEIADFLALANAKWPTGAVAQAAAVAAIEDKDHFDKTLRTVADGRAYLVKELNALGLPVAPSPQGNYVMFDVAPTGLSAADFADKVFRSAHVLIRGDFSPRYIRASIGTMSENERLVKAAAKLVKK